MSARHIAMEIRVSLVLAACAFWVCAPGCGGGGNQAPSPFTGTYAGTWEATGGFVSGTFTAVIARDGTATITCSVPGIGTFTGVGVAKNTGAFNASVSGANLGGSQGVTVTFSGSLYKHGNLYRGSGSWSSSDGYTGTWQAQQV